MTLITSYHFSNLNRRRYAQNDDTLYVAPEDERTDYVCHRRTLQLDPVLTISKSHNRQWPTGIAVS